VVANQLMRYKKWSNSGAADDIHLPAHSAGRVLQGTHSTTEGRCKHNIGDTECVHHVQNSLATQIFTIEGYQSQVKLSPILRVANTQHTAEPT